MTIDKSNKAKAAALFLISMTTPALAHKQSCTREDAIRAEEEATTLDNWNDLYWSYKRFNFCDDAAIADGYSDSLSRLFARHWEQFDHLVPLVERDAVFLDFVVKHLDETITKNDADRIRSNATERCPPNASDICNRIKSALEQSPDGS